jgi:hypothetical protein
MEAFAHAPRVGARPQSHLRSFPSTPNFIAAGQGTAGLELVRQADVLDVVVVPVGGGGLISGVAVAVKCLAPKARVYGVEPDRGEDDAHDVSTRAIPFDADSVKTIADGLAAPMAGTLNYETVKEFVDDIVVISDEADRRGSSRATHLHEAFRRTRRRRRHSPRFSPARFLSRAEKGWVSLVSGRERGSLEDGRADRVGVVPIGF